MEPYSEFARSEAVRFQFESTVMTTDSLTWCAGINPSEFARKLMWDFA
jgi:hypothetical protein